MLRAICYGRVLLQGFEENGLDAVDRRLRVEPVEDDLVGTIGQSEYTVVQMKTTF